jgi:hypothetical protein
LAGFAAMIMHCIGANTFIIVRIMEPFWFITGMIVLLPSVVTEQTQSTHTHTEPVLNKPAAIGLAGP